MNSPIPRSTSYEMIDRFLRNNLNDEDYVEYSLVLDHACGLGDEQHTNAILKKDVEICNLQESLLISRRSEKEAWRYHPEIKEENDALRKDSERYHCLLEGKRSKRIWNHVFYDFETEGKNSIQEVLDADILKVKTL